MMSPPKLALILLFAAFGHSWDSALYSSSPPVYPSPNTTGIFWDDALIKAKSLVAQLTLEEKVSLITGTPGPCVGNVPSIPRVGFTGLCLQDGPLAIREANYASVFPAGVTAATSWDREMILKRGIAIGKEFKGKGAHIALGPVAGPLGRSAFGGRNWEGFSPDPYLTGEVMSLTITGMQSSGVQAVAKHFIGNEQETQRNPSLSTTSDPAEILAYSANLGDRTMHELYLIPFADAIRAGVSSVMCSYNRINGTYACENSKGMNGLLKTELGFQGYIMSDWEGVHSDAPSILGGLDLNMPGSLNFADFDKADASYWGPNLTAAVNNGSVPVSRVDDALQRVLIPYYFLGQDSPSFPLVDPSSSDLNAAFAPPENWVYEFNLSSTANIDVRSNHKEIIRELGAAATVLLKNVNNTLPLKSPNNIAVFGNDAGDPTNYLYSIQSWAYEYGTLSVGGGSGTARLSYIVTPLAAIQRRAEEDGTLVQYILNNTQASTDISSLSPLEPEVCLVFLKTWASEGADRSSLNVDWDGNDVVENVANTCGNTIVVTHSSGINTLPFADHPNVTAILAAHYPGEQSGNSIVDVLWGDVNPSGRLPYTIANEATDYKIPIVNITTDDSNGWQVNFEEELYIDYRYFDAFNLSVRYPFGYGLSYTTFELNDLTLKNVYNGNLTSFPPRTPVLPGGNPTLWDVIYTITANVTNTGDLEGATVAQLYLYLPQSTVPSGTPIKQLRGFEKINLAVGASGQVPFNVTRRDLSYWDVITQDWHIPTGEMKFGVGFSSRDIPVFTTVNAL